MKTYSVLNQKAKNWWHFKNLRKRGQIKEARKLERASILKEIEDIRKAKKNGYFSKGRCSSSLNYFEGNSSSNCGKHDSPEYTQLIIEMGIPTVNTSELDYDGGADLCYRLPMLKWKLEKDENYIKTDGKYSTWCFVTPKTYKRLLIEAFGDKVKFHNWR